MVSNTGGDLETVSSAVRLLLYAAVITVLYTHSSDISSCGWEEEGVRIRKGDV